MQLCESRELLQFIEHRGSVLELESRYKLKRYIVDLRFEILEVEREDECAEFWK